MLPQESSAAASFSPVRHMQVGNPTIAKAMPPLVLWQPGDFLVHQILTSRFDWGYPQFYTPPITSGESCPSVNWAVSPQCDRPPCVEDLFDDRRNVLVENIWIGTTKYDTVSELLAHCLAIDHGVLQIESCHRVQR